MMIASRRIGHGPPADLDVAKCRNSAKFMCKTTASRAFAPASACWQSLLQPPLIQTFRSCRATLPHTLEKHRKRRLGASTSHEHLWIAANAIAAASTHFEPASILPVCRLRLSFTNERLSSQRPMAYMFPSLPFRKKIMDCARAAIPVVVIVNYNNTARDHKIPKFF
jgi:hypothetical protein